MELPKLSRAHGKRPVTNGIGKPYTSPPRRQTQKTKIFSKIIGLDRKTALLHRRLAELKDVKKGDPPEISPSSFFDDEHTNDTDDAEWVDEPLPIPTVPAKRILPDTAATRLYLTWKMLVPTLVSPLNDYLSASVGKPVQPTPSHICLACRVSCDIKTTSIIALFYDRE